MGTAVAERYLELMTDGDRALLASALGGLPQPAAVPYLLADERLFAAVFPPPGAPPGQLFASPFLTFAVAVARLSVELSRTAYLREWCGPGQRLPVFDSGELREFLADPAQALFLSELLGSYARVASGSYWTRTARGWRRRRWSELDPVRLAGLLDALPASEHPGVYRRLGDLALFLTGVFPDHTARRWLRPVEVSRLSGAAGLRAAVPGDASTVELLEELGARWYRLAAARAAFRTADLDVLTRVAERFRDARRLLNAVADRYLFPERNPFLPAPWS